MNLGTIEFVVGVCSETVHRVEAPYYRGDTIFKDRACCVYLLQNQYWRICHFFNKRNSKTDTVYIKWISAGQPGITYQQDVTNY